MTTKTQKITSIILLVFFAVSIFLTAFPIAFAEETDLSEIYTDVLDDLKLDPNFSTDKYRENITDVGFDLITISESDANELFLYLYQGGAYANLRTAKEVRISKTSTEESPRPKDYKLTLVSQNGVFLKYRVDGLNVESDRERYYQIIQIARDFIPNVDDSSSVNTGTTINTVVYPINQNWKACTQDDGITLYGYTYLKTIEITDRFDGFIRYPEHYWIKERECVDGHFIAFNTDLDMDRVVDADVSWKMHVRYDNWAYITGAHSISYFPEDGTLTECKRTLSDTDVAITTPLNSFWGKSYKWDRIQTVEEFKTSEEEMLKDHPETLEKLEGKKWVFRYVESPCVYTYDVTGLFLMQIQSIENVEVTVLRMKFEMDGETYNLGVVCNKITPDVKPDGGYDHTIPSGCNNLALSELLSIILIFGVGILILVFCPWVFTLLWWLIKGIWWLITFPFNLIGKKVKKKKKGRKNE